MSSPKTQVVSGEPRLYKVTIAARNTGKTTFYVLLLALLSAAAAFALQPAKVFLSARLLALKSGLIAEAEAALGKKITYGSSGFAFLSLVDIRNVSLTALENGAASAIPDMTVGRIRIRYTLPALFDSDGPLSALREVIIDRPETEITVTADGENRAENPPSADIALQKILQSALAFLPPNLTVRLNRGTFAFNAGAVSGTASRINALFHSVGGRARLTASWQLKAEAGTPAILAQNNRKPLSVETGARFRAELSHGADKGGAGRAALRLSKIKSDWVDLNALAFSVSIDESPVVTLRKTGGRLPFALSAALNLETGEASLVFNAKNTPVAQHITLKGPFRPYTRWIPESLDGNLAVTVQTKDLSGKSGMAMLSGAAPVFESNLRGVFQRQSPLGRSSFVVRGEGDAEHARAAELSLSMPQGRLSFNGSLGYRGLDINGRLLVDSFALRTGHPISGRFLIDTINRTTSLFAETVDISGVELAAVLLVISRETESADFSFSALRFSETGINNETGFSEVNIGRMSGYGFWNWKQNNLDVNFAMDEMIASDLYRMGEAAAAVPELPLALMEGIEKTKFTTDAYLSTDFKSLTYNIPTFVAAYRGGGEGTAENAATAILSISGTESYVTMNEAKIITPEGTITATADFEFEDKDDISFRMECTYKDLFYFLNGSVLDQNSVTLFGSYNLQAFFSLSDSGAFSGYIRTENARFPYKGQMLDINLAASVRYDSADSWGAYLDQLELRNLSIGATPIESLRISGSADQYGAALNTVSLTDANGTLSGSARSNWNTRFDDITFTLDLAARDGSEAAYADGAYQNGVFSFHANTTALRLSRFIPNGYGASFSGMLDGRWDTVTEDEAEKWSLFLNVSSLRMMSGGLDINVSTSGILLPSRISLADTRINAGGIAMSIPVIQFMDGHLDARITALGSLLGHAVDGSLGISANFPHLETFTRFAEGLDVFDGQINFSELRVDEWKMAESAGFEFSRAGESFSLSGGPDDMLRMDLGAEGDFYAGISAPSPIRGVISGSVQNGVIGARGSNLYVDLEALWNFVPAGSPVILKSGFALADIEVRGPIADPEFYGSAQGASVRLEVPQFLDAVIGPVPIALSLEGQTMRFGPVRAPCGSGWGTVTGVFEFSRWIPSVFTITVEVDNAHPIPYKVNVSGVAAAGVTSGFLEIAMEGGGGVSVTGSLLGENTEITVDPEGFSTASRARPSTPVFVSLTITTGRRVEFLWPNEQFPILQANPASGNSLYIEYDSQGGALTLRGDIQIKSGSIFYVERSFYIREGTLTFNEDETRFSPMLEARAEIRDRTDDGAVTIWLVVDNQPLTSFQARFESSPALSQADIFMLLGQSIVGASAAETGEIQGAFSGAISDMFSQFYIVRRGEKTVRSLLGLDMFTIRTQAFTNLFLQTVDRAENFRLGRYFDNTSIFAGKYITADLFLQGMLSLRYDETSSLAAQPGLRLEPDLGIELRNPLFDIRFNITPAHPESLFIPDTSVSLVWRRTF